MTSQFARDTMREHQAFRARFFKALEVSLLESQGDMIAITPKRTGRLAAGWALASGNSEDDIQATGAFDPSKRYHAEVNPVEYAQYRSDYGIGEAGEAFEKIYMDMFKARLAFNLERLERQTR